MASRKVTLLFFIIRLSRNIVLTDVNLNIVGYVNRYGRVRYRGTIGALTIIKASVLGILSNLAVWQSGECA